MLGLDIQIHVFTHALDLCIEYVGVDKFYDAISNIKEQIESELEKYLPVKDRYPEKYKNLEKLKYECDGILSRHHPAVMWREYNGHNTRDFNKHESMKRHGVS